MKHQHRLATLIPRVIRTIIADELFTCLPGSISKVLDAKKRKIAVKPGIIKNYLSGEELELPIVENVPLVVMGNDRYTVAIPFDKGDNVLLVFSQRALDIWLSKGKTVLPGDTRKFSINDAFAISGLHSFADVIPLLENNTDFGLIKENSKVIIDDSDNIIIKNENWNIEINNDGSLSMDNGNGSIVMATNGKVSINGTNLTVEP